MPNNLIKVKKGFTTTSLHSRGFTLIELLVVITIIAILSVIGITVYSGLQIGSRDAKRRIDIEAVSKTLEANYAISTGLYKKLDVNQFAGGGIPEDPKAIGTACLGGATNFLYCIYTYNAVGTETFHGSLTGAVPATFEKYTVCAQVEKAGSGNSFDAQGLAVGTGSKDFYCWKNQQ